MKKVAIFGKPGNGKSTLAKQLSLSTGINLHAVDSILYKANGEEIELEHYLEAHNSILDTNEWIIEGCAPFKSLDSFYKRLEEADTLIYIDLPYLVTYWLVTKRLLTGIFVKPEGWPEGSSLIKGTLQSYKVLKLCPKFWNHGFLDRLKMQSPDKTLHVVRTVSELNTFVERNV